MTSWGWGKFGARFFCAHSVMILALVSFSGFALAESPVASLEWSVDSFEDAVDAQPGDGQCRTEAGTCTLRAAIQESNLTAGPAVIRLDAGTYTLSHGDADENEAAGGDLDILDSVTIEGTGEDTTIVDGMLNDRVFDVYWDAEKGTRLVIKSLTLTGGLLTAAAKSGGAIYSDGELYLEDVRLENNAAQGASAVGGALYNDGGHLHLTRVTLSGNSAAAEGGGIFSSGFLRMDASRVETSRAVYGAGIFLADGTAFIQDSTIAANQSDQHGGAMHIGGHGTDNVMLTATAVISGSQIEDNGVFLRVRGTRGGGVFVTAGSVVYVLDSVFKGNDAASQCFQCEIDGGAIANEQGTVIAHRSVFDGNGASRWGGAVYNSVGQSFRVSESIFTNNFLTGGATAGAPLSGSMGGAIASELDSGFVMSHSLIAGNRSYHGSAIAGSGTFENVTIVDNTAIGDGAIFIPGSDYSVKLTHVTLARNSTGAGGANVHNPYTGALRIKNSIVAEPGSAANCMGEITSEGNNIISDASCLAAPLPTDVVDDPLLKPLADNGGFSHTSLPDAASPARDAVPAADCAATDQRFLLRDGEFCDAGATDIDGKPGTFGSLGFNSGTVEASESEGTIQLTVARSTGATDATSVDYLIVDGTAYAGENDYSAAALRGTLSWDAGDTSEKSISIDINDDASVENTESFFVHLLAPTQGAQLGETNSVIVAILDNDAPAAAPNPPDDSGGGGGGAIWALLQLGGFGLVLQAITRRRRLH